jgi:hypothetical protein
VDRRRRDVDRALPGAPDARVELADVPAVVLELRYRGPGASREDHSRWPIVAEIEVTAGERRTVTLP